MDLDIPTEAPDSPPFSIQIPPAPSPFDQICAHSRAPTLNSGRLDYPSYDQLRDFRKQHGNHRKGPKAALKARLASTREQNPSSTQAIRGGKDIPAAGTGERGRSSEDAADRPHGPTCVLGERCERNAPRLVFVVDRGVAKEHAQWRNPELEPQVEASRTSAVEGVAAAISAWVADECNRVSGQGFPRPEEAAHADFVPAEKARGLGEWESFRVSEPVKAEYFGMSAVDARWAVTWRPVGGPFGSQRGPVWRSTVSWIQICSRALSIPRGV